MEVDPEFRFLVTIDDANPGLTPMDYDIAHPAPSYQQNSDDVMKLFQADVHKVSQNANVVVKSSEEEPSVEELLACEKRPSALGKIRLTKRLLPETNELVIEGFDAAGQCVLTRVLPAGEEISEGEPLAKATITSSMYKTLARFRTSLLPEEVAAAEKAILSLDLPAFLQIIDCVRTAA
jgi:hypothetical protein